MNLTLKVFAIWGTVTVLLVAASTVSTTDFIVRKIKKLFKGEE